MLLVEYMYSLVVPIIQVASPVAMVQVGFILRCMLLCYLQSWSWFCVCRRKMWRRGNYSQTVGDTLQYKIHITQSYTYMYMYITKGYRPFVYRDGTGWPASLPYIRKIHISVAIGTKFRIRLHERVHIVKIWVSSKNDQNRIAGKVVKIVKVHFYFVVVVVGFSVSTHVSQKLARIRR